jgi:hypothetical protein
MNKDVALRATVARHFQCANAVQRIPNQGARLGYGILNLPDFASPVILSFPNCQPPNRRGAIT